MFADNPYPHVKVEDDDQIVLNTVFESFRDMPNHGLEHQPNHAHLAQPHQHAAHLGEDGSGDEPSASKRKRPHNGRACVNCRRRKARCQGGPPSCKTCLLYNDACSWGDELSGDGRRPASRTYVQALKTRIRSLEEEVKTLRGDSTDEVAEVAAGTGFDSASGSSPGGAEVQQVANTMLHLQMNDAGEERVFCFGPTSAFAHSSPILTPSEVSPSIDSLLNPPPQQAGDWRRYLPPTPYLTASQHNAILARFFKYFAAWGLRVHPRNFHTDMNDHLLHPPYSPLPRWSQYSPFLHNAILAVALIWADEPELRTAAVRVQFGKRADDFLKVELSRPLLATVQGLSVKSSYHSIDGDPTAGWAYFGMADRIAQTLGLNVDCTPHQGGMMSPAEVQRRTEMFWATFIAEQTWSIYTGRPPVLPEYTTPTPTIDPELDSMPFTFDRVAGTSFELAPSGSSSPFNLGNQSASTPPIASIPKPQDSLVSTTFVEHSKLAIIQQRVLTRLYGIRTPTGRVQKDGVVSALALELDTWVEALPTSLNINGHSNRNSLPHVIMLQLARESLTIFIHRPCYRLSSTSDAEPSSTTSIEAVRRCDRSAARIITLLGLYHQRFLLKYSPPPLFTIAFTAGTTFLLSAMHHPSAHVKMAALVNADKCVQYLRLSGDSWRAARRKADILQDLVNKYAMPPTGSVPSSLGTLSTGIDSSRQGSQDVWDGQGRFSRSGSVRPGSWQYPSPIPVQQMPSNQVTSDNISTSMPSFNRSDSVGTKRRRDTLLSDSTHSTHGSGEFQLPPMTPIQAMNGMDDVAFNDSYDARQWEQLLSSVGGVFDPPEMGPPPLPSQMQLGGRVSQFEYVPFRVPSQNYSATSLPYPSPVDTAIANHAGQRSDGHGIGSGQFPSGLTGLSDPDNKTISPYTVPLPRGSSAQAALPPVLIPSYASASSLISTPVASIPVTYTPRQSQARPTVDTGLISMPAIHIPGPHQSYVSPAESIAPSYFAPTHTISPESLGSSKNPWQMTPITNPGSGTTHSSASNTMPSPPIPVPARPGSGESPEKNVPSIPSTAVPDTVKSSMSSSLSSGPGSYASSSAANMAETLSASGSPWLGPIT